MRYGSWRDMDDAILRIVSQIKPTEIVGVVGVPRSGMIAAAKLATHLGVPLTSLDYFAAEQKFYQGGARNAYREKSGGKVLLVEDSATTCSSIQRACDRLRPGANYRTTFACGNYEVLPTVLFGTNQMPHRPVLLGTILPHPRIFAWNWLDSWITGSTLFDFDGIFCRDPVIFDDQPDAYREHIAQLPPMYVPKRNILGIVTNRLHLYRNTSAEWLKRHGVCYAHLHMRPENTREERIKAGPYGQWKGEIYASVPDAKLFVESDHEQARLIAHVAKKPVLCPEMDRML